MIIMINGGILSRAYSRHISYWRIPTRAGFCHGGNVPKGRQHHRHHHRRHHHYIIIIIINIEIIESTAWDQKGFQAATQPLTTADGKGFQALVVIIIISSSINIEIIIIVTIIIMWLNQIKYFDFLCASRRYWIKTRRRNYLNSVIYDGSWSS